MAKRFGGRSEIVDSSKFSDAHAGPPATLSTDSYGGSKFAPAGGSPPKYINQGKARNIAKGLTNKRFQYN